MRVIFKNVLLLALVLIALFAGLSSASSSPAKIVNGYISNAVSFLMKWLWSFKATSKTAISGRPMMKFEGGYTVETVFDGSKLGIEPYSIEVLPSGELLILDSDNSNLYRISSSLSQYTRPKLIAGSGEGYSGHIDGKLREARMNHPKGLTVDDRGNIYIADTMNMAIRKISDTGVTTIAGGKGVRGGEHVDGPSEDSKFSNDFDVVYTGSSCSLLVIDKGNRAIREIQLHFEDCAYQYGTGFPLGMAVLLGAAFFGYMLALLQHRVGTAVSSENMPMKSVRPPLIPTDAEEQKQEYDLFGSLGHLLANTGATISEILGVAFPVFRRKLVNSQYQNQQQYQQQQKYSNTWSVQESFVIPEEDEPPTPQKTYAFMSKDSEKMQQLRQSRVFYTEWEGDLQHQLTKKHHHHRRHYSSTPQTYYE